jgi:GntR family transcriptional regulator
MSTVLQDPLQVVTIDYDSPVPYYHQLKEWFHENIANGTLQVGQQIPSEAELCNAFHVSRTVVRQALNDLVNEGILYRRKGKGTFVAKPKISESLVQKLTGFYQDMVDRGFNPITRVLEQKVISASKMLAERLNLGTEDQVIRIDRLRFVNNEPIVFVTTYIPYWVCPGLLHEDLTSQSLYAVLEEKYGLAIARGRRTLEAIAANEQEAKLLEIEPGSAIILLKSVSYLEDGRPIEYYEAKHRGDRSQFEVELIRVRGAEKALPEDSLANLPRSNILKIE